MGETAKMTYDELEEAYVSAGKRLVQLEAELESIKRDGGWAAVCEFCHFIIPEEEWETHWSECPNHPAYKAFQQAQAERDALINYIEQHSSSGVATVRYVLGKTEGGE